MALAALAAVEPACGSRYQQVSGVQRLPAPRPRACSPRRPPRASSAAPPVAASTPRLRRPRPAWAGPGLGFEAAAGRPSAPRGGTRTGDRPPPRSVSRISPGGRAAGPSSRPLQRRRPGGIQFSFFSTLGSMSLEKKKKREMEKETRWREKIKSMRLLPTALRSEMRLLRVSEPRLLVTAHPPGLRFKTKVKMRGGTSRQVAEDFAKAMSK